MPRGHLARTDFCWKRFDNGIKYLVKMNGDVVAAIQPQADEFYINWGYDLIGPDKRVSTGPYRTLEIAERIIWDRILGVGK